MPRRPEIHVEPFEIGRAHRGTLACWCGPVSIGRDLTSGKAVFRHRTPPRRTFSPYDKAAAADLAAYAREESELAS